MVWRQIDRQTWNPFQEIGRLHQELQQLFPLADGPAAHGFAKVSVRAGDDAVLVTCELPGVAAEDIDLEVRNGALHLTGERKAPELADGEQEHQNERYFGRFERTIKLPFRVDAEDVRARYVNGVLEVELARSPEDRARRIDIQVD